MVTLIITCKIENGLRMAIFIADKEEDITALDTSDLMAGSVMFVAENHAKYVLDSEGVWN